MKMSPASTTISGNYPRVYRASGWWLVGLIVCGLLFSIGGMVGAWFLATKPLQILQARIWLVGLCCAFGLLGVYCLLWTLRSRVVLFPDRIEVKELTRTTSLSRQEIRGRRSLPSSPPVFLLVPRDSGRVALKVTQVFPLDDELAEWLYTFPSLDREDARLAKTEIRKNIRLGATPGERIKTLAKGRRVAAIFAAISIAVCVWGFVFPAPYTLAILVLTALPWLALELVRRSAGLFRVDADRNDVHPTVAVAFLVPPMVLLLRAVTDFNVVQSPPVVWFSVGIGGMLLLTIFVADPSRRGKLGSIIAIGLFCFAYGYGVAIEINVLLDRSPPRTYAVTVENKHASRGRTTTYSLELGPWGPKLKPNKLQVSRATYEPIHAGDVVILDLRRGALGVNWYFMRMWHRANESGTSKSLR
jgi:hypothetical protein